MSAAVTSLCRSTKARRRRRATARPDGGAAGGRIVCDRRRRRQLRLAAHAPKPHSAAARSPGRAPSARQAASGKSPLRRADASRPHRCRPGRSAARPGSKRSRPRACANRCTVGFQPPDTASRSQSSVTAPCPAAPALRPAAPGPGAPAAAVGADHRMAGWSGMPARQRRAASPGSGARIDDRRDRDPGAGPARAPAVGVVVVGEQHGALAGAPRRGGAGRSRRRRPA